MTTKYCVGVGDLFGYLRVLSTKVGPRGGIIALCVCKCGKRRWTRAYPLLEGIVKSCGCMVVEKCRLMGLSARKHGHAPKGHVIQQVYSAWQSMKQRCFNQNCRGYHNYGGRGITVCNRWLSFENFLSDMGYPKKGLSLHRIDNDGNYEPKNCCWASSKVQGRNRRRSLYVVWKGEQRSFIELCEENGVIYRTAYARLRDGWPIERVFDSHSHVFFQERNPRAKPFIHNGRSVTLSQLAREHNIKLGTLFMRIKGGWSLEEALTIPTSRSNKLKNIRQK